MADRVSALQGHYNSGRFGLEGKTTVTLKLQHDLVLHQLAIWPELSVSSRQALLDALEVSELPGPGHSASLPRGDLLRIEPLKWWLVGGVTPQLDAETGATLDLSHSRTRIDIGGDNAAALLNRLLPLDLRSAAMPRGGVASSAIHHVGVTLWRCNNGEGFEYALFIPRGFALSIWEVLLASAHQFGVEVI